MVLDYSEENAFMKMLSGNQNHLVMIGNQNLLVKWMCRNDGTLLSGVMYLVLISFLTLNPRVVLCEVTPF
jgi:hypothetical protein